MSSTTRASTPGPAARICSSLRSDGRKEKHRVALLGCTAIPRPSLHAHFESSFLSNAIRFHRASPRAAGHRKLVSPLRGFARTSVRWRRACRRSPGKLKRRCGPCTPARLCTAKAAAVPGSRTANPRTSRRGLDIGRLVVRLRMERPETRADVVGQAVARGGLLRAAHHGGAREVRFAHHHEVVALLRVRNPRNKYARGDRSGARRAGRAPDRTSSDRARACSSSSSSDRASRSWVRPHRASKRHSSRSRRSRGTRRPSARVSVPARLRSPREALRRAVADEPLLVRLLADDARVSKRQESQREAQRDEPAARRRSGTLPARAPPRAPRLEATSRVGILFPPRGSAEKERNGQPVPCPSRETIFVKSRSAKGHFDYFCVTAFSTHFPKTFSGRRSANQLPCFARSNSRSSRPR